MLPPHRFYYLHNFRRALEVVARGYADLLDDRERAFLQDFDGLPQPSQALFVRLAMRRGPWFRASRLVYEEIADVPQAAEALVALGWLDDCAPMTLDELFGLCTVPELRNRFGAPAPGVRRKADWLEALRPQHEDARRYRDWDAPAEPVWRFMLADLCDRLRLMFFGNFRQDWSEFVLADLGVFRYEAVAFDAAARAFRARGDIEVYLKLHACRAALDDGAPLDEVLAAIDDCASDNAWLEQRRAKVLLRIGQACERAHDWVLAQRVYEQCSYPGARHRRIRVWERMGRHTDAWRLALEAQRHPESESESQAVAKMLPRLRRNAGQPASPRAAKLTITRSDLVLAGLDGSPSVEHAARDHLHEDESPVFYVENTLINGLFGLLCWPAIFAPVPGAFFHPFQRGPADLGAPDFIARRAAQFAACLNELEAGTYRDTMWRRYTEKAGVQSPFVAWGALSESLLDLALDCIPARHLRLFFTRILQDIRTNRTGLPDLIQFWPAEGRYRLIEIKGPGDTLQDNQIRWLQYCGSHGIAAEVCHVRWQADGS